MTIWIQFTRLRPTATQPTQALPGDACWDLYASEAVRIQHNVDSPVCYIHTGLAIAIPAGWEGQVRGRSGLSSNGLFVLPGTVDAGYRGEVLVMAAAFNFEDWYDSKAGDRIAQLAIRQVPDVRWEEVARLPSSERGRGGFGSSGR